MPQLKEKPPRWLNALDHELLYFIHHSSVPWNHEECMWPRSIHAISQLMRPKLHFEEFFCWPGENTCMHSSLIGWFTAVLSPYFLGQNQVVCLQFVQHAALKRRCCTIFLPSTRCLLYMKNWEEHNFVSMVRTPSPLFLLSFMSWISSLSPPSCVLEHGSLVI